MCALTAQFQGIASWMNDGALSGANWLVILHFIMWIFRHIISIHNRSVLCPTGHGNIDDEYC